MRSITRFSGMCHCPHESHHELACLTGDPRVQINDLEEKNGSLTSQCEQSSQQIQGLMQDKIRLEGENRHLISILTHLRVRACSMPCRTSVACGASPSVAGVVMCC